MHSTIGSPTKVATKAPQIEVHPTFVNIMLPLYIHRTSMPAQHKCIQLSMLHMNVYPPPPPPSPVYCTPSLPCVCCSHLGTSCSHTGETYVNLAPCSLATS